MATIDISHPHLNELVGESLSVNWLENEGSMLGILFEDTQMYTLGPEYEQYLSEGPISPELELHLLSLDPGHRQYLKNDDIDGLREIFAEIESLHQNGESLSDNMNIQRQESREGSWEIVDEAGRRKYRISDIGDRLALFKPILEVFDSNTGDSAGSVYNWRMVTPDESRSWEIADGDNRSNRGSWSILDTEGSERFRIECSSEDLRLYRTGEEDKLHVEVEPNRPDLLSVEGISRALRGFLEVETGPVSYPIKNAEVTVRTDEALDDIRPHIACARVRGLELTQSSLNSLIQLQEKVCETYGRQREKIAIGLHDFEAVEPPIDYWAAHPEEISFVPLHGEQAEKEDQDLTEQDKSTLSEILKRHEKGQEYGWILEGHDKYPVITDRNNRVFSFPPITNGILTKVTPETTDLFVDVTGTSKREVETALNIMIAALYERGGSIEAIEVDEEKFPKMGPESFTTKASYVRDISGIDTLSEDEMRRGLEKMRHGVSHNDESLDVEVPAYRADIMHSYDIIEDLVIGYGYQTVDEVIPDVATVGGLSQDREFTNKLREFMVGTGSQEMMTFVLSNPDKLFTMMDAEEQQALSMANPRTEDYTVVRNWLLPSLIESLRINRDKEGIGYPQTIFEIGKCSVPDEESLTGASDRRKLAYAHAGPDVSFSDARSTLQSFSNFLGLELSVESTDHPSFHDQRCGRVLLNETDVGFVGRISESVRENWKVEKPIVAFELNVEKIQGLTEN